MGLDPEERDRIFELGKTGGVSRFVFDVERPRLNEAALVSKTNPEISTEENAAEDNPKDYGCSGRSIWSPRSASSKNRLGALFFLPSATGWDGLPCFTPCLE